MRLCFVRRFCLFLRFALGLGLRTALSLNFVHWLFFFTVSLLFWLQLFLFELFCFLFLLLIVFLELFLSQLFDLLHFTFFLFLLLLLFKLFGFFRRQRFTFKFPKFIWVFIVRRWQWLAFWHCQGLWSLVIWISLAPPCCFLFSLFDFSLLFLFVLSPHFSQSSIFASFALFCHPLSHFSGTWWLRSLFCLLFLPFDLLCLVYLCELWRHLPSLPVYFLEPVFMVPVSLFFGLFFFLLTLFTLLSFSLQLVNKTFLMVLTIISQSLFERVQVVVVVFMGCRRFFVVWHKSILIAVALWLRWLFCRATIFFVVVWRFSHVKILLLGLSFVSCIRWPVLLLYRLDWLFWLLS